MTSKRRFLRYLRFAALLFLQPAYAEVEIALPYQDWVGLPPDLRTAYLAGTLDSLLLYAADARARSISVHFHQCLKSRGIEAVRLGDNVRSFSDGRSELPASVQEALLNYLVALCGRIEDPTSR